MRLLPGLFFLTVGALCARPYFTEPAISPDNSEIAFVSGGDIWTVPSQGGQARLLISNAATESRPLYSPDGKRLAFVSTRSGNGDVYVLTFASGELKRITFDDGPDDLNAWSRDGKYLYFSNSSGDIAGMNDIYRVSAEGGTPMQVSADRYANEYFAAPAPQGDDLAFTARGIVSAQWWRKGHSHLDESEIWLRHAGQPARYERFSDGAGKALWPMWSADGKQIYYVSDRDGAQNIFRQPVGGPSRELTHFRDGRVLWPVISYDSSQIVFARDFRIWKLNLARGAAEPLPIELRGAPAGASTTHLVLTQGIQELSLSPDGKKIAFVVHGEIFATSSKDGGNAVRVSHTAMNEMEPVWAPDNHRLVYVSDRDGIEHLYSYDFNDGSEKQLTKGNQTDVSPLWSHDGKRLAYLRGGRELHILDIATSNDRILAEGYLDRVPVDDPPALTWSPDDRWIAFTNPDRRAFRNVQLVATEGPAVPKPVSFLANTNLGAIVFSPDGKFLLFQTNQRTENGSIARVDLVPRTPHFREDQFRDLFREETPRRAAPQPANPATSANTDNNTGVSESAERSQLEKQTEPSKPPAPLRVDVQFEGIRQRLALLPLGVSAEDPKISPDGKTLLITAGEAGERNLYTYSLDDLSAERPVARQLTSTPGRKNDAQWSPDGKDVYFLENGRIQVINLASRQAHPLAVTADMDVNFAEEKYEIFRQAWFYLKENFYDPKFHGNDWEKIREEYAPEVEGAQTHDELRQLINLMVGELNASHSGIGAPGQLERSTGRLGLQFDRAEYELNARFKITEVVDLSPTALAGNIKPGNYLLAIDGQAVGARTNLDEVLDYRIDRRVVLTIADDASGTHKRDAVVRPVNLQTEKGLLYRQWVEKNRAYVSRISNGRLGYVHLFDMSSSSLEQLQIDLDAENQRRDGVIIDIRNNNGGFVNAYALDFLSRRGYLNMTERGFTPVSARSVLGQRALERPTILVVNQHSLSDAEDFTEGYRTLKLGKVVGEPTAGWIIYTTGTRLIDGSTLRLPEIRITANDGSDMEGHPRQVDISVVRPIGESYADRDSQLDAAAKELLAELSR